MSSFLFEAGKRRRVMHIERFTATGEHTFTALCDIPHQFNRTCNLPLGQRICKRCRQIAEASHD